MGAAPTKWITPLGANNNWAWRSEYSDCHQDYCGTRMVVLGNRLVERHAGPLGHLAMVSCHFHALYRNPEWHLAGSHY